MKEKCLITGANGFIGNRLQDKLRENGLTTVNLQRESLSSPELLRRIFLEESPDRIFHLAAYGNHYSQTDRREVFQANLMGTFNLLDAAAERGFRSFTNTGSSSEYGRKRDPMSESQSLETDTFYGASKVGATFLARAFASQLKLPIVTVRPFSVYGPGEANNRFIPTVIRCALSGEELILSPGVHDWIHIDDFIEGMILVSENASVLSGEVVNIGSGSQYSNEEIVSAVEHITNKPIKVKTSNRLRVYDTETMWVANNDRIRRLGWKPKYELLEGLRQTIDAFTGTNL